MHCNICGSLEFKDFSGRKDVLCCKCDSLERHRLLRRYLSKSKVDLFKGMATSLVLTEDDGLYKYVGFDDEFFTRDYACIKFDAPACFFKPPFKADLFKRKYNTILHCHVLNKCKVDWRDFIVTMIGALGSGGKMIFTCAVDFSKRAEGFNMATQPKKAVSVEIATGLDMHKIYYDELVKLFSQFDGGFSRFHLADVVRDEIRVNGVDLFVFQGN